MRPGAPFLALALCLGVAACTPPQSDPSGPPAGYSDTRQTPSNTESGLHIGGHVEIGVKRSF